MPWRALVTEPEPEMELALLQVKMEDPQWSALSAAQCRLLMEYANHAEMAEDPSTFVTAIAEESPLIFNNIPEADKKEDTIAG